uniref:Uncharacterized protein n=1 Tax=Knipowitschia caucasica TaxID=637954 RepID=A0AAV2MFV2_KNICA
MAALFIVAIVASAGFLLHRKYSRVQSLERSSSGSYLNFTRTSTNPNNGALSALTRCPPQHEGLKVIDDEPVYSNVQPQSHPPSCWTADVDESIYANV